MMVNVTHVQYSGGTIATGSGTDERGRTVTFAGDWRPMQTLAEAVESEGEVEVYVPEWAVLSIK